LLVVSTEYLGVWRRMPLGSVVVGGNSSGPVGKGSGGKELLGSVDCGGGSECLARVVFGRMCLLVGDCWVVELSLVEAIARMEL
jgi:hypothetical protein